MPTKTRMLGYVLEAVEQLFAFNQQDRAVKTLLKALNDPDPGVVMEAVEGLAHNPDKKVIFRFGHDCNKSPRSTYQASGGRLFGPSPGH